MYLQKYVNIRQYVVLYMYMFYYFIDVTVARITCIKLLIELQHMVCFLSEYFKIL